jgi:hypothetical protein
MGLVKFLFSGKCIDKEAIGNNPCINTEEHEKNLFSNSGNDVPYTIA